MILYYLCRNICYSRIVCVCMCVSTELSHLNSLKTILVLALEVLYPRNLFHSGQIRLVILGVKLLHLCAVF